MTFIFSDDEQGMDPENHGYPKGITHGIGII